MLEDFTPQSISKTTTRRVSKQCHAHISPLKQTFTANFTKNHQSFDVTSPLEKKMRRDLFGVSKKVDTRMADQYLENFESTKVVPSDNPVYEDPRDVITEKSTKPVRKKHAQDLPSPRTSREGKAAIKEHKRKLTKKYESLIMTLMERCEENVLFINEKESQLTKLKDKLKEVLEYNKLFAEENDRLKSQHTTMIGYIEDCKQMIDDLNGRNKQLEVKSKELNEKVKQYQMPDREHPEPTTVPLVEVCMNCSSREIVLRQSRDHNARLQADMHALKDVLYRLNIQLSRYQEKLRNNIQSMAKDTHQDAVVHKPGLNDGASVLDSLVTNSIGHKQENSDLYRSPKCDTGDQTHPGRVVDLTGLLSAQALAPLFDAYQESIQEKENLILDYERQFESINRKTKQIVLENKELKDTLYNFEGDNSTLRQNVKKLSVERETLDIDRATLLERCEKAESKLKEVYELYEDKMAAMMRDYETVHREYFATKSALALAEGKVASLDAALRAPGLRTVPADLHERRVDSCKRLLEDLKHQYSMDAERKNELLTKLQQESDKMEEKLKNISEENENIKKELKGALKNVRLYRKAAVIFRQRLKASVASMNTLRRSHRRYRHSAKRQPTVQEINKLETIKQEIKRVKLRAYSSLEELERRIRSQEMRAARAEQEHQRELERAQLVLEHKERIIRSLIDKVADVEEVRLSQSNSHRLQGIVPEESSPPADHEARRESSSRLMQASGGYFQDVGREVLRRN